ncbi:MAG: Uma2 family endonuclease [Cyanobacteriota bacterium]|nr:Uma2 family endonuclease [Cyanobacteriota bacterium]
MNTDMSAILEQLEKRDRAIVLTGISWSQLETLDAAFSNMAGVKLFYLDGILEIMTVSPDHEDIKRTIGLLVEAYMREKGIRFYGRGAPTLGGEAQNARKEPDESYNIGNKKENPDLVIEVIFTSGGLDKLQFYKRIGVFEVWFWEDGVLSLYCLDGEYQKVNRSKLLPDLDIAMLARYIVYFDQYDAVTEFLNNLRET